MKWGYKYKDGDIVLNEKVEGEALTEQGVNIWAKQERNEYRSDFGYDRNFFITEGLEQKKQIVNKLDKDLEIMPNTTVSYDFSEITPEVLNIKLNFKKNA